MPLIVLISGIALVTFAWGAKALLGMLGVLLILAVLNES